MNYYNEFDPKAAAWLRELIKAGLIPAGDVDERSITEVKPHELAQYTQCHFFAGIGGWSLALQFAGWAADRPVGTGSCPCQPFSAAGSQLGNADARHLWPAFFKLIHECRALGQRWTDTIFGEQVESAIGHGWLDSVSADLEGEGYAVGAAILGAHSVGAPHRRQRLYWGAYAQGARGRSRREMEGRGYSESGGSSAAIRSVAHSAGARHAGAGEGSLANRDGQNTHAQWGFGVGESSGGCGNGSVADTPGRGLGIVGGAIEPGSERYADFDFTTGGVGDTDLPRPQGRGLQSEGESDFFETWTRGVDFITCTDGRKRLIKPGIFPLAHGFPCRVGLLRGSGNAIVPQVAAQFIIAAEEAMSIRTPTEDFDA